MPTPKNYEIFPGVVHWEDCRHVLAERLPYIIISTYPECGRGINGHTHILYLPPLL